MNSEDNFRNHNLKHNSAINLDCNQKWPALSKVFLENKALLDSKNMLEIKAPKKDVEKEIPPISERSKIENIEDAKVESKIEVKSEKIKEAEIEKISEENNSAKNCALEKLRAKLEKFEGLSFIDCAQNLVFSDGNPDSKLMLIGEAPGQEEDKIGKPFVGKSGMLLTDFLSELHLDRTKYYITNVINWRPPGNRTPTPEEITIMQPFLFEHIAIINPDLIVTVGAIATKALGIENGITKIQGHLTSVHLNIPGIGEKKYKVFPIYHPSYALRLPQKKRDLWVSLLKMNALLA